MIQIIPKWLVSGMLHDWAYRFKSTDINGDHPVSKPIFGPF
jgi:predicted hydrolase (HD superfamily)